MLIDSNRRGMNFAGLAFSLCVYQIVPEGGQVLSSNDIIFILVCAWSRDVFDPGGGKTALVGKLIERMRNRLVILFT